MAHEIMENDQMFSVNEVPWHGLGVLLPHAPTLDEALTHANLSWKVRKLALSANQPPMDGQMVRGRLPIRSHKALQREDTGEIFTVVSNQYQILQNEDAFGIFRPLVDDGWLDLETAGSLQNGRKVWILARIAGTPDIEVRDRDVVKPYVMLSNSHDGTQAVRLGFTPIRVVCNNTLTMAVDGDRSMLVRVYHRGDIQGNLEHLRRLMDLGAAQFVALTEGYRDLANNQVSEADLKKYIRVVLNVEPGLETPREKAVIERLINGRGGIGTDDLSKATWWDAYNAVNEWMVWERGRSNDTRLASVWFGDGYTMDQRALTTAFEFAKVA